MKNIKYLWVSLCAIMLLGVCACSDSDGDPYPGGNGPVTVSKVYLLDQEQETNKKREVDFARLGQTILLEGTGFGGTRHLYVNGYETYFNTTLVTDNAFIVSLNSNTPVSKADPEKRNKIEFEKDGTTYSYEFVIRAATPRITSINNTLPKPGETVTVYGSNLQETSEVLLPGGVVVTDIVNATDDEEDGQWFSFVMPQGVTEAGAIEMTGANGKARSAEYFNNDRCMILDFDGRYEQGAWGGKNDDGTFKEGASMVYPEDLVDDPLNSGRGKCLQLIPQRLLDAGGILASKPRASECWTAGNDSENDDWTRMLDAIPATTPVTDFALQFDIYVPDGWNNTGQLQVSLINNYNIGGYNSDDNNDGNAVAFYMPWLVKNDNGLYETKEFKTSGWQTVTIPFSEFKKYSVMITDGKTPTLLDVITDRNAASYRNFGIGFANTDLKIGDQEFESSLANMKIYIDNWRVVPCSSKLISDFPDEDEPEE